MAARPLYQQVKDHILDRIRSGAWAPGDLVSSEHDLVRQLGASRMTINRALRELTQDGLLVRKQGLGTFVAEPRAAAEFVELRNIAEEIAESGRRHSARLIQLAAETAQPETASALELQPGSEVFHSILLHLADEEPLQIEDRFVNPACAPSYLDQDLTEVTPNAYLSTVSPAEEVEHLVEAVRPEPWQRRLLEIPEGEPGLRLHRRTWSRGAVASSALLTYPGSAHRFATRFAVGRRVGAPNAEPRETQP